MKIKKIITSQENADNVSRYFSEIRNFEPLTKEQEKVLIIKYQDEGCQRSLDLLLKSNLKFVISVAKHYQGLGSSLLDLVSEGNAGMIEAARRFDRERDLKFFSYAVLWMRIRMFTTIDFHKRTIQLPANRELLVTAIREEIMELEQRLERYPSLEEIEVSMKKKYKEKKKANPPSISEIEEAIIYGGKIKSINEKVSDDDEDTDTLEALIPCDSLGIDDEANLESMTNDLNRFLFNLEQKEYDVLVLSLGLNGEPVKRLSDIALAFKIKEKDIIKYKARALKRLKRLKNISSLKTYLK